MSALQLNVIYIMIAEFTFDIVKLHSELALPTELQLDRVGVDFAFPPSQLSNN